MAAQKEPTSSPWGLMEERPPQCQCGRLELPSLPGEQSGVLDPRCAAMLIHCQRFGPLGWQHALPLGLLVRWGEARCFGPLAIPLAGWERRRERSGRWPMAWQMPSPLGVGGYDQKAWPHPEEKKRWGVLVGGALVRPFSIDRRLCVGEVVTWLVGRWVGG